MSSKIQSLSMARFIPLLAGVLVGAAAAAQNSEIQGPCAVVQKSEPLAIRDVVIAALDRQPQLIIAQQDVEKSRANLTAALTPFLPSLQAVFEDEKFVPKNGAVPVTVVGNNILGGTQTYSAYGSLALNWNIFSGGKDVAGYKGALAGVRSSQAELDGKLDDVLAAVLQAYSDVFKAQRLVREQQRTSTLLREIQARAEERFRNGTGTTLAIGQASAAALEAQRSLYQACRGVSDKSAALAKAAGLRLLPQLNFSVSETPSARETAIAVAVEAFNEALVQEPAVKAARENIAVAETKLRQSKAAIGPTLAIVARKDYLGQDPTGVGGANHGIGPNSYRFGLMIQQPLLPATTETGAIRAARADLRRAEAEYSAAMIDAQTRLQNALSALQEAVVSLEAAEAAAQSSRQVLALTDSLYRAGRMDLDNLQRAQIDLEKSESLAQTLAMELNIARWMVDRSLHPADFPRIVGERLGINLTREHSDRP